MRGVFDDEMEPDRSGRDTELTLGSGTLLIIFFGLVLLCGLCFGLGYTVGHRTAQPTASTVPLPAASDQEPLQPDAAIPKPQPTQQAPVTPAAAADQPPFAAPGAAPAAAAQAAAPSEHPQAVVQPVLPPAQPQVRPALAAGAQQPAAPEPAVRPAIAPNSPFMVQIAAVSTPEDAEVLMDALRRHGYAVTVRRDLADNLIHVRIGPFATRAVADQWRQKLLNDGYNAIVQP